MFIFFSDIVLKMPYKLEVQWSGLQASSHNTMVIDSNCELGRVQLAMQWSVHKSHKKYKENRHKLKSWKFHASNDM